jgi:glycosyltransferase involved in cell wall biosynthesis
MHFKWVHNAPKTHMPKEMERSDLLLLTSTHEGFPNVVKEALASNTPFVATDVSDLKEIAKHTETCYVAKSNAECIASCIVQSLTKTGITEDLRGLAEPFRQSEKDDRLTALYRYLL